MKNGMNVAAISELVHEIRKVPHENEIDYAIGVVWRGGMNCRAHTRPLRFGTKRLGRDFSFDIGHVSDGDADAGPSPADCFMLGLGSCVGNILVQGASYKGITLDWLRVDAAAALGSGGLADLDLAVRIESDGGKWQYKQMMMNVARFSPNYITVTMPNAIETRFALSHDDAAQGFFGAARQMPAAPRHAPTPIALGVDLAWRNATQFDAVLRDRVMGDQRRVPKARLSTDQPAPAAGLNEAPNPQEYLLAGVASDLLQTILVIAAGQGVTLTGLSAEMSCHLDMKGCFNLFSKSAIQLQKNRLDLTITGDVDEGAMARIVEQAKAQSPCYRAFVQATRANLERHD